MSSTRPENTDAPASTAPNRPRVVVESVAGFTAGFLNTLVVHPLDLIKTRLQGTHPSIAHMTLQ